MKSVRERKCVCSMRMIQSEWERKRQMKGTYRKRRDHIAIEEAVLGERRQKEVAFFSSVSSHSSVVCLMGIVVDLFFFC